MDAPDLVEIVNPNGRKGLVAASSEAAKAYKRAPSQQEDSDGRPAGNASAEAWRAYATDPTTPNGLSAEDAEQMSRDELVAHFKED